MLQKYLFIMSRKHRNHSVVLQSTNTHISMLAVQLWIKCKQKAEQEKKKILQIQLDNKREKCQRLMTFVLLRCFGYILHFNKMNEVTLINYKYGIGM